MQYEKYELKIQKIESFFKFIFRHLGMVITVSSLVVATTVGLLAARGTVKESDDALPTEVVYGETFRYRAKAFMSKVSYEYSPAGAEAWTQDVPLVPGDYQVRAVAKATFGYRYGEPTGFTVKPKPIQVSIASSEVPYGDEPKVTSNDLVYADKIEGASFTYNENRSHAEIASVLIRDENGADITSFYEITTTGSDITTVRRRMKFKIEDASKVYDGTPLTSSQYEIIEGSLAKGDRLEVAFDGALTDVGRVQNVASYTMINAAGENVTPFYDISETAGILEVLKREVAIKTHDLSVPYDATVHAAKTHEITSAQALAAGHTLATDGWADLLEVGTTENRFSKHQVLDAAGNDVTANYALDITWGTLTVTTRQILLSTGTPTAITYDGVTALRCNEYTITDLESIFLDGHEIVDLEWAEQINAGTIPNEIKSYRVVDQSGADVTRYYALSPDCVWGTLEVKPIVLTVWTDNYEGDYDGLDHATDDRLLYDAADLLSGHELVITERPSIKNVGDSGEDKIVFAYKILDRNNNDTDVTDNYDPGEPEWGDILIRKKSITVSSNGKTFTYNGSPWSDATILHDPLSVGDEIQATSTKIFQNVSDSGLNELTYQIKNGGKDVSENYEVTEAWGTVTIEPCSYTLTTKDQNWTYDGNHHTNFGYVADAITANGHRIQILMCSAVKDYTAVAVDNKFDSYKIVDAQGKDVTENYLCTSVTWGKLSVEKCPYSLTTPSKSWTYDGTEHSSIENYTASAITENGHRIVVTRSTTVKNYTPTAINNEFLEYRIVDGEGNDVTENYFCEHETLGTLKMNRRVVLLRSLGAEKVYDGTPLNCLEWVYNASPSNSEYEFLKHHTIRVDGVSITEPKEQCYNYLTFTVWEGNEEVTDNYQISQSVASLIITKRPITIMTGSYNGVYDGEYHASNTYTVGGEGLVLDHVEVVPTLTSRRLNVGTTKNGLNADDVKIMSGSEDKTDCYEITVEKGDITITRRQVIIQTNSSERHYDGTNLQNQDWTYHATSPYQLVAGHNLYVAFSRAIRYVGEEENVFISHRIVDDDGRTVSLWTTNYELLFEHGTLKITKRPITVTPVAIGPLTYDGTDQSWRSELVATNIPSVDRFWFNPNTTELRDATSYGIENEMAWDIFDANGESVKDNYDWGTILWQMVIIERRQIAFHYTSPEDFIYDGDNHAYQTKLTVDGLPVRGVLVLEIVAKQDLRNVNWNNGRVAAIYNEVVFNILNTETGERFGSKYLDLDKNFTYEEIVWDNVTISPKEIVITTPDYKEMYDGRDHSEEAWNTLHADLCWTDEFRDVVKPRMKNVWDSGENRMEYKIYFGDEDVTANYKIAEEMWGTIEISQRPLKLGSHSDMFEYDGITHEYTDILCLAGTSLVPTDFFTNESGKGFRNVKDSGTNILTFEIYSSIIGDERVDMKDNYAITYEWGTVTITPRYVVIETESMSWPYDGEEHSHGGIAILPAYSMVEGETLRAKDGTLTVIRDYGKTKNIFAVEVVGSDPENYEIKINDYGTLIITRAVRIYLYRQALEYDGLKKTIDLSQYVIRGIDGDITGVNFELTGIDESLTDVGSLWSSDLTIHFTMTDEASGEDVTELYHVVVGDYETGDPYDVLVITKRVIVIHTKSQSKTYDGKPLVCKEYYVSKGSFASGHRHNLVDDPRHGVASVIRGSLSGKVESGYNLIAVDEFRIWDADGNEVQANYEVTFVLGTLTIT